MIAKDKKQAIIKEYGRSEGDTGSPEVQIAILTARIAICTDRNSYSKNQRTDRSLQSKPERSPLKKRSS